MRSYEARLARLEADSRQPENHLVSVVYAPWHLDVRDEARWPQEDVPCACGRRGCPALQIGVLLPAPSVNAWAECAQKFREDHRYA